ncbi:hypothetical protein HDZ31DRAFT_69891 [Schizophyllum fasciatum]
MSVPTAPHAFAGDAALGAAAPPASTAPAGASALPSPAQPSPTASVQPRASHPTRSNTGDVIANAAAAAGRPAADAEGTDVAVLQATIAALQAQLATQAAPTPSSTPTVTTIARPRGEAGSSRGFRLRDAMGLGGSEEERLQYMAILRTVRTNALKYGIDPRLSFRKQDPEKLAKVYKAGWRAHPYLTPHRFPAHWAQSAMLKQYLTNLRKYLARHGQLGDDTMSPGGSPPPPPSGGCGGAACAI